MLLCQVAQRGSSTTKADFRRPHDPSLDGPFFLDEDMISTTRGRELSVLLKDKHDSGLGPGEYNATAAKDCTMKRSSAAVVRSIAALTRIDSTSP